MLSNLVSQLKEQNALDKYEDVLAEMPRVREELGYPPLVTPTSQIVGTQAVLNVIMGERYKVIPKEVKDYVRGYYGKTPAPISEEMISKIIEDERPITVKPADLLKPEYEKMKKEAEGLGIAKSEEDILTYIMYPAIAPKFLKGEITEEEIPCACPLSAPKASDHSGIPTEYRVEVDGSVYDVKIEPKGGSFVVKKPSGPPAGDKKPKSEISGAVVSSMQGMILSVKAKVGSKVNVGDVICVIEAMKMENAVNAPHAGIVQEIIVAEGDTVANGDVLMIIG
jgi:pyruvate carboxylase subunit B